MGRRQDTMVARFTSFGQGGTQQRGSHSGKAVELQKMPQRIIAVPSIECLTHFPPLGCVPPRARSPVFSAHVPCSRSDGDFKGMARLAAHSQFIDDTTDAQSNQSSQSYESMGNGRLAMNGHMPDMSRTQADWLRAQLQDAQLRCQSLQKQLGHTSSQTSSPAKAASALPAGCKQQPSTTMQPQQQQQQQQQDASQQAQEQLQQQVQQLQQKLRLQEQQLQAAHLKMAHVQENAQQLLATFQQNGYEVAAGLDSLQDDLDELEQWSDAYKKQLDQGLPAEDPLTAEVFSSPPATPGTAPKPRPSLEKMVMLRARREHVEAAYLDLTRLMVSGLEGLVTKCK